MNCIVTMYRATRKAMNVRIKQSANSFGANVSINLASVHFFPPFFFRYERRWRASTVVFAKMYISGGVRVCSSVHVREAYLRIKTGRIGGKKKVAHRSRLHSCSDANETRGGERIGLLIVRIYSRFVNRREYSARRLLQKR